MRRTQKAQLLKGLARIVVIRLAEYGGVDGVFECQYELVEVFGSKRTRLGSVVPLVRVAFLLFGAFDECCRQSFEKREQIGGPVARVGRVVEGAERLE